MQIAVPVPLNYVGQLRLKVILIKLTKTEPKNLDSVFYLVLYKSIRVIYLITNHSISYLLIANLEILLKFIS